MYNPSHAFNHLDRYVVYNTATSVWIESAFSEHRATQITANLNAHETRCSRPSVYSYKSVTECEMTAHIKGLKSR